MQVWPEVGRWGRGQGKDLLSLIVGQGWHFSPTPPGVQTESSGTPGGGWGGAVTPACRDGAAGPGSPPWEKPEALSRAGGALSSGSLQPNCMTVLQAPSKLWVFAQAAPSPCPPPAGFRPIFRTSSCAQLLRSHLCPPWLARCLPGCSSLSILRFCQPTTTPRCLPHQTASVSGGPPRTARHRVPPASLSLVEPSRACRARPVSHPAVRRPPARPLGTLPGSQRQPGTGFHPQFHSHYPPIFPAEQGYHLLQEAPQSPRTSGLSAPVTPRPPVLINGVLVHLRASVPSPVLLRTLCPGPHSVKLVELRIKLRSTGSWPRLGVGGWVSRVE